MEREAAPRGRKLRWDGGVVVNLKLTLMQTYHKRFAREKCNMPFIPTKDLVTSEMKSELGAMEKRYENSVATFYNVEGKKSEGEGKLKTKEPKESRNPQGHDTVGCVCRDSLGRLKFRVMHALS